MLRCRVSLYDGTSRTAPLELGQHDRQPYALKGFHLLLPESCQVRHRMMIASFSQ